MGLFKRSHQDAQGRVDQARRSAEHAAAASGSSASEVASAGDAAAGKQRLKNVFRGVMGKGADPK